MPKHLQYVCNSLENTILDSVSLFDPFRSFLHGKILSTPISLESNSCLGAVIMSYWQEVMEVARLFQWSLLGTKREYTPSGGKKTRGVELMLQKLRGFFLARRGCTRVHIRRPEISGNTLEKFLYPNVWIAPARPPLKPLAWSRCYAKSPGNF